MALQIIAGAAGSGKTYYANHLLMSEAEQNPNTSYFAVVPEQLNLSMQQDFLRISSTGTLLNVDVVSFERLAERIIGKCGLTVPSLIDDTGKCLLIRKVAGDVSEDLTSFKRSVGKPGFVQIVKSMLSELFQYGVSDEKLFSLSGEKQMPLGLSRKLKDIALIYQAFNAALETGIPKETLLTYVTNLLPRFTELSNSVFLFDSFTGFTPLQELFVTALMKSAKMVYVTVTIDRAGLNEKHMERMDRFYMSKIYLNKLYKCAETAKAKVLSPVVLDENRRTEQDDLKFLSSNLFSLSAKDGYESIPKNIVMAAAESPLKEVQGTAEEIYHLVSKEGYSYKDIAVIVSDVETYAPHVTRVFSQADFSYYMDTRKNVHDTPVISYIMYAVKSIVMDAEYESMFAFLKSGLVLSVEECSILENYVLAKGIRGFSAWAKEWKRPAKEMNGHTLDEINVIREKAVKNLLPLRDVLLDSEKTVTDVLTALVDMMQKDGVYAYTKAQEARYEEEGDTVRAKLYEQLYGKVLEVFDQFVCTLGESSLQPKEYYDILAAGFAEIKAGVLPATKDCIIVGDMERTRVENIKALFFLGLTEGSIPNLDGKVDLLNRQDRDILERTYDVELTPSMESKQSFQQFYFYLMLSKPSERLYLYRPELDNSGKSLNPSSYLHEIKKLFPSLDEEYLGSGKYYINDKLMMDMFAEGVRSIPKEGISTSLKTLGADLWSREENREEMREIVCRAFYHYDSASIGAERAKLLYGNLMNVSPTRLEQAAACPFSHFLKYGLGVAERDVFEASAKDIGSVYHMVLEDFFKGVQERKTDWTKLTAKERRALVTESMERVSEAYRDKLFKATAKNRYYTHKISTVIENAVEILGEQIVSAGYSVKDVEVKFSGRESKELHFNYDGAEMMVSGRVDRMDVKDIDGLMYAKVIDYKTGDTNFDATLVYNGLQLQLLYMDAAKGLVERQIPGSDVRCGGFAYFHIKDDFVETDGTENSEQVKAKRLKDMEPSGIVNLSAEPEAKKNGVDESTLSAIQKRVHDVAYQVGSEIFAGNIAASPYKREQRNGCTFCPYKAVCGFDAGLPGYEYRVLQEKKKEDFLEEAR